jgi:hypothetical protein
VGRDAEDEQVAVYALGPKEKLMNTISIELLSPLTKQFMETKQGNTVFKGFGRDREGVKALIKSLYLKIHERAGYLQGCKPKMLKDILPSEYWSQLTDNPEKGKRGKKKIYAGYIVSYLVEMGLVPFIKHVTPSGKGSKKYYVK